MTKLASPEAMRPKAVNRLLPLVRPLNHSMVMLKGSNHWQKLRQCCSANISVGAMIATW